MSLSEFLRKRPLTRPLIAWMSGVIIAYFLPSSMGAVFLIGGGVSAMAFYKKKPKSRWLLGFVVLSCLFCGAYVRTSWVLDEFQPLQTENNRLKLTLEIRSPKVEKGRNDRYVVKPLLLYEVPINTLSKRANFFLYLPKEIGKTLTIGDRLTVDARLLPNPQRNTSFGIYSYLHHIVGSLYLPFFEKDNLEMERPNASLFSFVNWQQKIVGQIEKLPLSKDESSILAAMLIGEKRGVSQDMRTIFSASGIAHLLAVSGFHVGIVASVLFLFVRLIGGKSAHRKIWVNLVVIALIWLFILICGAASSAVRAGVMSSLYFLGKALKRRVDSLNILIASAFIIELIAPLQLFDVGFQLSYAAVSMIILIVPWVHKHVLVRNPLIAFPWNLALVSLSAQVGTMPLTAFYFGEVSLVFLLTNLLLLGIITVFIPIAGCYVLLSFFIDVPFLVSLIAWGTKKIILFTSFMANLPNASIAVRLTFLDALFIFLLIFGGVVLLRKPSPRALLVVLTFLLLGLWLAPSSLNLLSL